MRTNTAGLLLAALTLLMSSYSSRAETIYNLSAEVVDGIFAGTTGSGFVSYDEALLTGIGEEFMLPHQYDMELEIFGQTFTEADDIDAPDFPILSFELGVPMSLELFVMDDIDNPLIEYFEIVQIEADRDGNITALVDVSAVPIPASLWLMTSGVLGMIAVSRRS